MKEIPTELMTGPFTRARAGSLGVTSRMLDGARFVRIHPRVWRHRDHTLTEAEKIEAASLALPASARLTGLTRIQQLGLDFGPRRPLHFVVEGELHLALDGIFLHRTVALPPLEDDQITPAAAYLAFCVRARIIDAIKVGSWLLAERHTTKAAILDLATGQPWRDGAAGALWTLEHLSGRSASMKESELLALVTFAGLPTPEVNVRPAADLAVIGDLVYRRWGVVVEYEGRQHQLDRGQYVRDIGRYSWMRDHGLAYVQVTHELISTPRLAVGAVYRALASRGYDGPPPQFDKRWRGLFDALSRQVLPRRRGRAVI